MGLPRPQAEVSGQSDEAADWSVQAEGKQQHPNAVSRGALPAVPRSRLQTTWARAAPVAPVSCSIAGAQDNVTRA